MNITQAARAFCRAKENYYQAFRDYFQNQVQSLDAERFWQLQPVFAHEVYTFRFGYDRTNGVEHAAGEFFRKPYAEDFTNADARDVPRYTLEEAVRFAKSWREISRQLYEPLLDATTVKSDDSYGDLLDSLPLAGREVVERSVGRTEDAIATYDQLCEAVRQACGQQKYPQLSPFILNGENYVAMHLYEAAQEYFALQANKSSGIDVANDGQTELILNVHGNLVEDVFCSDPDVKVTLVDWNVDSHGPNEPEIVEVQTQCGRTERAYVADYPKRGIFGLKALPDSAPVRYTWLWFNVPGGDNWEPILRAFREDVRRKETAQPRDPADNQ